MWPAGGGCDIVNISGLDLKRASPEAFGVDDELEWQFIDDYLIVHNPYAVHPNAKLIGVTHAHPYLYFPPAGQFAIGFLLTRVGYWYGGHAAVE
jgi:hypothetical protein